MRIWPMPPFMNIAAHMDGFSIIHVVFSAVHLLTGAFDIPPDLSAQQAKWFSHRTSI
jgi:hypothetical protein